MEYVIFFAAFFLLAAVLFGKEVWDANRAQKRFVKSLYEDYGKLPKREYSLERFARIDSYFQKHFQDNRIDDITWNDLGMDEIFKRMNYTLSSTGEEYLYYTLRTPETTEEELLHLEEMIAYFAAHRSERVKVQVLMKKLGTTGKYSLYDYLDNLNTLGKRSNWKPILVDMALLLMIILCFFQTALGVFGCVVILVYHMVSYFSEKKEISPYITSFAYVLRLISVCEKAEKLPIPVCETEWEKLRLNRKKMTGVKKGAFWVISGSQTGTGGNPLEIIMDYVRMALHVDIMVFNRMLSELTAHLPEIDVLIEQLGKVETAVSIGAYRASLTTDWCQPEFTKDKQICINGLYHPLMINPVTNHIAAQKGVLLTGSNASGKSTFLKAVAVNAILAQTIHTCCGESYKASFFRIFSSMALKDNMQSGESYYIVEIKSIKRILDASCQEIPVLCFVDEVLRGTNTVERIAASTQILRSLAKKKVLCFAATHDIELTELLKDCYDNYHFEEHIIEGDIFFPYQLLPGKAVTRNAIKLLELLGYDEEVISRATAQAEHFLTEGVWEA